jgi:pyruvate,water dikinase
MQSGEQVQLDSTTTTETTVTGKVANRGRAVGTARLVNSLEDIDKVNRGDILISVNTIPPLLPAMVKSSGIITDVGGMLSHAAIVSREFGIPCLVGTKTATKVFTDGDQVELNAYDGIARKLPKS